MEAVIQHLRDNRQQHLDWAIELCRIPSISTQEQHAGDVRKAVVWTRDLCEKIGLNAEIHETPRHPLVYAEHCEAPGAPTYLVYGHLDVQPTGDESLWDSPPFEPTVKGDWLICRGSADDKGLALVHLRAAAAWLATEKKLPVNLKILLEGEEEIGSPNLEPFVREHREKLACDAVLISDTGMIADGYPTITYGTRGLLYKEIKLRGPVRDLHSGSYGGSVANPANVLARLLASLHDEQNRINIPGFYDDVAEVSADERAKIAAVPFDEAEYFKNLKARGPFGEAGYTTAERRSIRPTLDVNGIYGGYMQPGANTIVPAAAGAKVSMRLVPNQDAKKISGLFDDAIRARCPKEVELEILNHGVADAYVAPLDSKEMKAAADALETAFDKKPAFTREGGSLPILPLFKDVLNADSIMLGFASPDSRIHGPNEKVRIPDIDRGAEAVARMLAALGSEGSRI